MLIDFSSDCGEKCQIHASAGSAKTREGAGGKSPSTGDFAEKGAGNTDRLPPTAVHSEVGRCCVFNSRGRNPGIPNGVAVA
jgi:hypothetical protein